MAHTRLFIVDLALILAQVYESDIRGYEKHLLWLRLEPWILLVINTNKKGNMGLYCGICKGKRQNKIVFDQ